MKYAIIGAGGTGGSLGFFLTKAGKDVTLIARGKHLEAIRKNGLGMERLWDHKREMIPVKACTVEEYSDTPDVILVCVKGYSMTETIPVIRKLAGKDTVVLPILNIYGTGGKLQKEFPELTAEALPRGVCRKKSVCEKNTAMIFIVFSDILPFTARNFIQIQKVLTIFLISMVWNIMAICHSLNIWNTRR